VLYELGLLLTKDRVVKMAKNLKILLVVIENIAGLKSDSPTDPMLPVLQYIDGRVNKSSTVSIVTIKDDVADEDVKSA